MTILNVAVAADRCALLSDCAVSGDAGGEVTTSKAIGLPHLGVITGAAGSLALWLSWIRLLLSGMPVGTTPADLAATGGEFLRSQWERTPRPPSSIALAGATGPDTVGVWLFVSPTFEAVALPPGLWLQPGVDAPPAAAVAPVPVEPAAPGPERVRRVVLPAEPWPLDWPGTMHRAGHLFDQQREQRRTHSGGSLECVLVTPSGIHCTRQRDNLEFLAATPT